MRGSEGFPPLRSEAQSKSSYSALTSQSMQTGALFSNCIQYRFLFPGRERQQQSCLSPGLLPRHMVPFSRGNVRGWEFWKAISMQNLLHAGGDKLSTSSDAPKTFLLHGVQVMQHKAIRAS